MRKPVIFGMSILMALCSLAMAANLSVPSTYPTIQAAIDAAAAGDSVVIAPGTYTGVGNRDINFKGKAITVRSIAGPATCIIDCAGLGRGFLFETNEKATSVLQGLTIKNGRAVFGGAIECYITSPSIRDCVLMNNTAEYGGGIDCYQGSPTIFNCVFQNNTAHDNYNSGQGGAIALDASSPSVINCLFQGNKTDQYGIAVDCYSSSSPVITNCTFVQNQSASALAAAVYADGLSALAKVVNSVLWDNSKDISGAMIEYSCVKNTTTGTGVIMTDPLFRKGPKGDFYLSQILAGQLNDSPCLNAGDPLSNLTTLGINTMSTRTDNVADADPADMGYHYPGGAATVQVSLTVGIVPDGNNQKNGTINPAEGTTSKVQYSEVPLTATPNVGFKVTKWTGTDNDAATGNTNTVTLTGAKSVSVEFGVRPIYILTTAVNGPGTISPATGPQNSDDIVTLTATPDPGYRVGAWTGTDDDAGAFGNTTATVLIDKNKTVTVAFVSATISRLDVRVIGGHGSVIPRRGDYPVGTQVNLTAYPDDGYRVKQWIGTDDDTSLLNANTVTMDYSKEVTVEFERITRYWLRTEVYSPDGTPHGTIAPDSGWFDEDEVVDLTATPDTGYEVLRWINTDLDTVPPGVPNQALTNTITMVDDTRVIVEFRAVEPNPWQEGEIRLNSDPAQVFATIQEAMDAAAEGDEVVVSYGVYTGTGNKDLDFKGKAMTVRSQFGPEQTIINCQGSGRGFIFQMEEPADCIVRGFTIMNANGDRGGAIYVIRDAEPVIENCIFQMCRASQVGGAVAFAGADELPDNGGGGADPNGPGGDTSDIIPRARLADCQFLFCQAGVGAGGAVFIEDAEPTIVSCEMMYNSSGDGDEDNEIPGGGGAIYIVGDAILPNVVNCLIVGNQSGGLGGGLLVDAASPNVLLCTFTSNFGGIDPEEEDLGPSGDIVAIDATPYISHCIIWGGNFGLSNEVLRNCAAEYSCLSQYDPYFPGVANIYPDDPMFITGLMGDYYLSQEAGNQEDTSACVDAGLMFLGQLGQFGLSQDITTSVTDTDDTMETDLGYHYPKYVGVPVLNKFKLYPVPNGSVAYQTVDYPGRIDPPIQGVVGPDDVPAVFYLPFWSIVEVRAMPNPTYRVMRWTGTDDDTSTSKNNTATMDTDHVVFVTFEQTFMRVLVVPDVYSTIEKGVRAARDGDIVVVAPGTYFITDPEGIDFQGKAIKLISQDPDDPDTIQRTIIDCQGNFQNRKRAFYFHTKEGSDALIAGFTIRKGWWNGGFGNSFNEPGYYRYVPYYPWPGNQQTHFLWFIPDPPVTPVILSARSGPCGRGDGYGGAILCENGSSPTIEYCVFEKNTVTGGQGVNGETALSPFYTPDNVGHSVPGGQGGAGFGNGYGGAIACIDASSPIIRHCTFNDNAARGGMGGIGGNAGPLDRTRPGNQSRGGDGGDGFGDGRGGAIYAELGCSPYIFDCQFIANEASEGLIARGGNWRNGAGWPAPWNAETMNGVDGTATYEELIAGGALYYADDSHGLIYDCIFADNRAFDSVNVGYYQYRRDLQTAESYLTTRGGAIYLVQGDNLDLKDCSFDRNLGGAIYSEGAANLSIDTCAFRDNGSPRTISYADLYNSYFGSDDMYIPQETLVTGGPAGAIDVGRECPGVVITDCDFGNNFTFSNGGAVNTRSNTVFTDCRFGGNRSDGNGGAVFSNNDLTFDYIFGNSGPTAGPPVNLDFTNCSFILNESIYGGAIYLYLTTADMKTCYFVDNFADSGGGLFLADTAVDFADGLIRGNRATLFDGHGGGIASSGSTLKLDSVAIEGNIAEGDESYGGGISFFGWDTRYVQSIKNCLFQGNQSAYIGGALSCRLYVQVDVSNTTIVGNQAGLQGGAIFSDWSSKPNLLNSIVAGNNRYAVYEQQIGGDSYLINNQFFGNEGDLFDAQTGMVYNGPAALNAVANNSGNIDGDPLFVSGVLGAFYLGAGSPAIDAGSALAEAVGLNLKTTQVNNQPDTAAVDLGYHYNDIRAMESFTLTASVIGGHGKISPTSGTYYKGQAVTVTAKPDATYRVEEWGGGTINDNSKEITNVVIMDANKHVTVQYDQPRVLVVGSTPRYTDIQRTIDDAEDGDIVMIQPGTYRPAQLQDSGASFDVLSFLGKSITLTGFNPDDPANVAATVLDDYDLIISDAGPNSSIEGITFIRFYVMLSHSDVAFRNCHFRDTHWTGGTYGTQNGGDGENGASLEGPVRMTFSSPKFLNCRFENLSMTGGDGERGQDAPVGFDGGWPGWAHGGAVYCGFRSHPIFDSCEFINCIAQGGTGGDGGNSNSNPPSYGGRGGGWTWAQPLEDAFFYWWDGWQWGDRFWYNDVYLDNEAPQPVITEAMVLEYEWDRWAKWFGFEYYSSWAEWIEAYRYDPFVKAYDDYWRYGGLGGAVYAELDSNPTFIKCLFDGNRTYGAFSGVGGNGDHEPWPDRHMKIENGGGAFFATRGCKVKMVDCTLRNNIADSSTIYDVDPTADPPAEDIYDDYYVSFGGGVAYTDDCVFKVINTTFKNNEAAFGGGLYFDESTVDVADCNFIDNLAYHGGGAYSSYSSGLISNSFFGKNLAAMQPAVSNGGAGGGTGQAALPALPHDVLFGYGAGLFCLSSDLDVADSIFKANSARGSGGGIYYLGSPEDIAVAPQLFNTLLYQNVANLGGGGVASAFYARPCIANCTITENRGGAGNGGGVFASFGSDVDVINSIVWDNGALNGAQLAVGSGDEFGPRVSTVTVTYTDIGPTFDPNAVPEIYQEPIIPPSPSNTATALLTDEAAIQQMFTTHNGKADVIVTLRQPVEIRRTMNWKNPADVQLYRAEVADRITAALNTLQATDCAIRHRFENIAAFSATVNQTALDTLLANRMVASIEPVRPVHPLLRQSIALAHAEQARQLYDGTGVAIAIVDSGVDYRHPMLGGGSFPNAKVIGGYDVGDNDADPMPSTEAHGTCCAGIAAGTLGEVGDYVGGVAFNAKIYALKLTGNDGSWANDAGLRAWDWCITHQYDDPENPIMIMSNSWGNSIFFQDRATADAFSPAATQTVALAVERGITVLAASGNEYQTQGIIWPAAMTNVISVGAVFDTTDQVTPYSNTAEILDILAPADPMYTTDIVGAGGYDPGDYFATFAGTSSATPFAAGCVADIQRAAMMQIRRFLTPEEVRALLIGTGDPVTDTKVAITKPRVNLGAAVANMISKPIYVEDGCILEGWHDDDQKWDPETYNLGVDPMFVGELEGAYFLSEIAAGQLEDSPCLNAGSDQASVFGLDKYATRSDSGFDLGVVNLGFHHREFVPEFAILYTSIFGSSEVGGYTPTITPHDPKGIRVKQYTQFELKVQPAMPYGYGIIWSGTDDDLLTTPENTVTVNRDKVVVAEMTKIFFELQTEVVIDPVLMPNVSATVTPSGGMFRPLSLVHMKVDPIPAGYQARWTGTDKDNHVGPTNYVTMNKDTKVTVRFEPIETKYYGIVIGISDYPNTVPDLLYAETDASQFFSKLMQMPQWKSENVRVLLGGNATLSMAQLAYSELIQLMDPDDVFVFYFAGHGIAVTDAYPIDEFDGLDEALVLGDLSLLTDDQMAKWINGLPTQHYAVFVDAGFRSGTPVQQFVSRGLGVESPKRGDDFGIDLIPHETVLADGTVFTADPNGLGVVVSATQGDQVAWEYPELQHGLFTYQLIKAIDGAADWNGNQNGWVSAEECFAYVSVNVSAWMEDWDNLGLLPVQVTQDAFMYDAKTDQQVEFMPAAPASSGDPKTYYVPGTLANIQEAITMARDGDLIVLAANTYQGGGLVVDKNVTITSANPDDPEVVAATIIDCTGTVSRGVYFTRNAGPGAVLNGITIQNGVWTALPPDTGIYDGRPIAGGGILVGYQSSPTIKNCIIRGFRLTGGNAVPGPGPDGDDGGFAIGAGIYCSQESAPTIINTTITDCHVIGGNATSGVSASAGDAAATPPVPASPLSGRGGWGGGARGGGVYIAPLSKAVLRNCTISNCSATGGNGGNGGNYARVNGVDVPGSYGGLWSDSSYAPWQAWGYIGDYRYYAGSGAGVYCEIQSEPKFIECLIQGNQTRGGMSGRGGTMPAGQDRRQPITAYELPSYGGGVFCGEKVKAEFVKCRLYDNTAPKPTTNFTLNSSLGHGGGIAFERSASIVFDTCSFQRNDASIGAGMYYLEDSPMIADCNFIANTAYEGGGLFADGGAGAIDNSEFSDNLAGAVIDTTTGGVTLLPDLLGQGGAMASVSAATQITNSRFQRNFASTSGGGLFFSGTVEGAGNPLMNNCLVVQNIAGRDGGGVSSNWFTLLTMSNCTLTGNDASGVFGQTLDDGYGGGLYCAYHSEISVDYSIVWNNNAAFGRNLVVGTGFEYDPRPGKMTVSNTFMSDGWSAVFALVQEDCVLDKENKGNLDSSGFNPLFVTGRFGDYYLSQLAAGQTQKSPCVDPVGISTLASELGMDRFTTRIDGGLDTFDTGIVDLGYHYPMIRGVAECRFCDIGIDYSLVKGVVGRDGRINLADFAVLASTWLSPSLCAAPGWCQGADINRSGHVEINDLLRFSDCWFDRDDVIPLPNPAEWAIDGKPKAVPGTLNQISMTAEPAMDDWGWEVAYRFEVKETSGTDPVLPSDWLYFPPGVAPTWIKTGLKPFTSYTFTVRVAEIRVPGTLQQAGYEVNLIGYTVIKDSDVNRNAPLFSNWTEPSVSAAATAGQEDDAPTEIEWQVPPRQTAATAVSMEAAPASDASPPLTYHFRRYATPNAATFTEYPAQTTRTFVDTNVVLGQSYTYSFVVIDRFNNTSAEAPQITVTLVAWDTNPPLPDPMTWEIEPIRYQVGNVWYDFMQVSVAADPEGTPVQYQILETESGDVTGWQLETDDPWGIPATVDPTLYTGRSFWIKAGGEFTTRFYQCRARDGSVNRNTTDWSTPKLAPYKP